jgi:hypothetical protein
MGQLSRLGQRRFDCSRAILISRTILVFARTQTTRKLQPSAFTRIGTPRVVTVTAGNAGSPTYESVFDDLPQLYQFKGRVRVIDSITVPWQGGITARSTF